MDILSKVHKHYGTTILLLVLIGAIFALTKGPKVTYQRIVAVLVDINVVIGLATLLWVTNRPVSWFHILFGLGAIGLLHASAKSDQPRKVAVCWGLAFLLLIGCWAANASWGPAFFKAPWQLIMPSAQAA
jgi:hypothetical protein